MTRARLRRLSALEDSRRRKEAGQIRQGDVSAMLRAVFAVVGQEAGEQAAARVAWRVVAWKAGRAEAVALRQGGA